MPTLENSITALLDTVERLGFELARRGLDDAARRHLARGLASGRRGDGTCNRVVGARIDPVDLVDALRLTISMQRLCDPNLDMEGVLLSIARTVSLELDGETPAHHMLYAHSLAELLVVHAEKKTGLVWRDLQGRRSR